jgi:glycosyltransferase involved in cell wall biosynthesis
LVEIAMKVYWLTEAFYPPIVGGQELIAAQLVEALSQQGVQVNVITRQTLPRVAPSERIGGVVVRRIEPAGMLKGKGWRAVFPLFAYLIRLGKLLLFEASRYDVIIVSGAKVMPLVVVPICWLTHKQCIVRAESFFELHEPVSTESLRSMNSALGRFVARVADYARNYMLRRVGFMIAISSEIGAALVKRGVSSSRIREIPNAVDLEKFKAVSSAEKRLLRRKLALPAERTLAVYTGRLARGKGLPMLIESWPTLVARHPELSLVLVGSGWRSFDNCEDFLRDFVRDHQLQDHVHFVGETERVNEFLQAADFYLFPTEYEGFSLALVEALACSIPVVVTSVGAAPDIIRHGQNGFMFPPKDMGALIDAIESVLQSRARWPIIGVAARETVQEFGLSSIAARYLELCRELALRAGN